MSGGQGQRWTWQGRKGRRWRRCTFVWQSRIFHRSHCEKRAHGGHILTDLMISVNHSLSSSYVAVSMVSEGCCSGTNNYRTQSNASSSCMPAIDRRQPSTVVSEKPSLLSTPYVMAMRGSNFSSDSSRLSSGATTFHTISEIRTSSAERKANLGCAQGQLQDIVNVRAIEIQMR